MHLESHRTGKRVGSGSGDPDPDLYQNNTDPEPWFQQYKNEKDWWKIIEKVYSWGKLKRVKRAGGRSDNTNSAALPDRLVRSRHSTDEGRESSSVGRSVVGHKMWPEVLHSSAKTSNQCFTLYHTDPDPAFWAENRSESRVFMTKDWKKFTTNKKINFFGS